MDEAKKSSDAPVGTVAVPENPQLVYLKEREQMMTAEVKRLNGMNPNQSQPGFDLIAARGRAQTELAQIQQAIKEAAK